MKSPLIDQLMIARKNKEVSQKDYRAGLKELKAETAREVVDFLYEFTEGEWDVSLKDFRAAVEKKYPQVKP